MLSAEAISVLRPIALANYSLGTCASVLLAVAGSNLVCIALQWDVLVEDSVHALSLVLWLADVIPADSDRLVAALDQVGLMDDFSWAAHCHSCRTPAFGGYRLACTESVDSYSLSHDDTVFLKFPWVLEQNVSVDRAGRVWVVELFFFIHVPSAVWHSVVIYPIQVSNIELITSDRLSRNVTDAVRSTIGDQAAARYD
jgi:hypothetical protein